MFKRNYFSLFLVFFLSVQAYTQQYNFINYSVEEGLVQSQIGALCQDEDGYIWIGTYGGVSKFDGVSFQNYSNNNGLINNQVNSIFKDSKNNLWFGSLGGVSIKKGEKFESISFKHELSNFFVLNISEDINGNIWFATDGGGIVKYSEGNLAYYDINSSANENNNYVRHIFCDTLNNKWLSTRNGVFILDAAGQVKDTIQNINATQVLIEENGNFWCSTFGDGVIHATADTSYYLTTNEGLISNHIRSFIKKSDRSVWLASKSGISKLSRKGIKNFTQKDGLVNENVKTIIEDVEGNLFLGTDGGGLIKFTDEDFISYTEADGLNNSIVMSIIESPKGTLWLSTYGSGICKKEGNLHSFYDEKDGLGNNTVWFSTIDYKNRVWFGTSNGFSVLDGEKFKTYNAKTGLNANKVYALSEDENHNIWIGSKEGLSILYVEKDSIYNFSDQKAVAKNIRFILNESPTSLWICSSEGLINYNPITEAIYEYTTDNGLPDNSVMNILKDRSDKLWVGTKNGLVYIQNKTVVKVPIEGDYSSNNINFTSLDKYDNLWLGTNNGLYKLSLNDSNQYNSSSFVRYSNLDGLKSLECNQNASFIDCENNLWFGTSLGLMKHPLKQEKKIIAYPQINLKDVRLFFEKQDWRKITKKVLTEDNLPDDLVLKYNKNHLTFDFDGIYHRSPDKVKFRFKLEGFDENWQPVTKANFVTYSNIPPGSYVFHLSASIDLLNWTEAKTFSFEIKPPFWFTWWFYLLSILTVAGIIWLIVNRRIKFLERQRSTELIKNQAKMMELEQQALNASLNRHFIFNALNSIQYYINRQDRLSANKYLSSFAKLVRKNLDSSMENETSIDDEIERIELYLKLEQMRFQNKFDYKIKCDPNILNSAVKIPSMLLQPFVENSIWHGILPQENQGEVLIDVKKSDETLTIIIRDNGIGIETSMKKKVDKEQLHVSKGMALTKGRINLLSKISKKSCYVQGPYQIYKKDGSIAGTEVSIIINLQEI